MKPCPLCHQGLQNNAQRCSACDWEEGPPDFQAPQPPPEKGFLALIATLLSFAISESLPGFVLLGLGIGLGFWLGGTLGAVLGCVVGVVLFGVTLLL